MKRTPTAASLCPADASHGPVLLIGNIYWCPNQKHDSERIRPVQMTTAAPRFANGLGVAVDASAPPPNTTASA